MKSVIHKYWLLIKESGRDFVHDNGTKLSASLAYYTIFSIGPLMIVVFTLMGLFYKRSEITPRVFDQVGEVIGKSGASQLQGIVTHISVQGNSRLFTIIGTAVLIFGATSIFTEIQSSINYIWSIRAKPRKSWLKYILDRLLSFSLVVGCGFLALVTLVVNLVMDMLEKKLEHIFGTANVIWAQGFNMALLFVVVVFLFSVVYKVLPDASIHWRDALTGATFTGVLFLAGKFLISYYLGKSTVINAYGAAASVILLLSWVYYSSMILYFGAEFTKVYAIRFGRGITIYDTAVYIVKQEAKELPLIRHPLS